MIRLSSSLLIVSLLSSGVHGQDSADLEFLTPMEASAQSEFSTGDQFSIRETEYFAKPYRFGLYRFDVGVLEEEGRTITVTAFDDPPIEILSHGIKWNSSMGGFVGRWTGTVISDADENERPFELSVTRWAIDIDGNLRAPDPHREATLKKLENDYGVISEQSLSRVNERQVFSVDGDLAIPLSNRTIRFTHPTNDLDYVAVYEVDPSKVLLIPNDMRFDPSSESGKEAARRDREYRRYIDKVKRELGLMPTQ